MTTVLLLMFVVTFFHVFFAAFQNQNIIYRKWWYIPPSSYALTASKTVEVSVVAILAVQQNWLNLVLLGVVMGTAGWMASFASMKAHERSSDEHS